MFKIKQFSKVLIQNCVKLYNKMQNSNISDFKTEYK